MKINFNRKGSERKALVMAIGELLGQKPQYKGAPTFIYQIGDFEVDKDGTLIFEEAENDKAEDLLGSLKERGFNFEEPEKPTQIATGGENLLVIEIPKDGFTEASLDNLKKLIESKGGLIKKALNIEGLPIEEKEETLLFPWFSSEANPDEVKAYTHFIAALCDMAKNQKRVIASSKNVENEKYAFRCFLLRLGFIGDEYRTTRKILLSKLTGSSAFKTGASKDQEVDSHE